jgi:hypothetical protein
VFRSWFPEGRLYSGSLRGSGEAAKGAKTRGSRVFFTSRKHPWTPLAPLPVEPWRVRIEVEAQRA